MKIDHDVHITLSGFCYDENVMDLQSLRQLVIYCVVHTFSQAKRGWYDGNLEFLSTIAKCDEQTARRHLKDLCDKGYIEAIPRAGKTTIYKVIPLTSMIPLTKCNPLQNEQQPLTFSANTPYTNVTPHLKEELKNNKESDTHAHTGESLGYIDFDSWWNIYDMKEYAGQYADCKRYWIDMTPEQQHIAWDHTKAFAPVNRERTTKRQPKYYLLDKDWMNDISTIKGAAAAFHFLDGQEIAWCMEHGVKLSQVQTSDGLFKIMKAEDAKQSKLKIIQEEW